jgi:hypothetical protein
MFRRKNILIAVRKPRLNFIRLSKQAYNCTKIRCILFCSLQNSRWNAHEEEAKGGCTCSGAAASGYRHLIGL